MNTEKSVEELKKDLEEAKAKCEEYLNGWKRERADFLNYKKSEAKRIGELLESSDEMMLLKILPIFDNILLAFTHVPIELKDSRWVAGFIQIKDQFADFLEKQGVDAIKSEGKFDPNIMDAVEEVKVEGKEPGIVIGEVQRGYVIHGRLLRPAKVKISK
ncbi:MAG: nucleotide exchange factor GrpE [Candidatus Staskawiczbacteria bacterium]|jgi:molecular chaperone GrpE